MSESRDQPEYLKVVLIAVCFLSWNHYKMLPVPERLVRIFTPCSVAEIWLVESASMVRHTCYLFMRWGEVSFILVDFKGLVTNGACSN